MWIFADHLTLDPLPWLTSPSKVITTASSVTEAEPELRLGPVVCRWTVQAGERRLRACWQRPD